MDIKLMVFSKMLQLVFPSRNERSSLHYWILWLAHKVKRVIITYKDRLSRVGYDRFEYLFAKYHVEIVVMSEIADKKTDQQEIFDEIISLLSAFSMCVYSGRRKKIKEVLDDNEESEVKSDGAKDKKEQAASLPTNSSKAD